MIKLSKFMEVVAEPQGYTDCQVLRAISNKMCHEMMRDRIQLRFGIYTDPATNEVWLQIMPRRGCR